MRKKVIAGNWKMNKTPTETQDMINALVSDVKHSDCRVVVAPSFVCLPIALQTAKGSNIIVAAQNMADHEDGAYTGEVSAIMLKDLGIEMVVLGHSERRQYYGETNNIINEKVKIALKHGFEIILCIGETLNEREANQTFTIIDEQIKAGLKDIDNQSMARIILAYEPVWAIGTGKTASSAQAEEVHAHIREFLTKNWDKSVSDRMVIQYGGSVKPDNIQELMAMPNIDGALVGGASLKAESFIALVNYKN
jgi:triosephosphate isomerase